MSEKRRDNKNRILRTGESQRKDGRYRFKYVDANGNNQDFYSWRLEPTDPTPKGKRQDLSLREKEAKLSQDMNDGIIPNGDYYTVTSLCEKYLSLKTGLRPNTLAVYKSALNMLKADPFGKKRIDKVRISDAKQWIIKLQEDDGRRYSSIHVLTDVLRPAFQMAYNDDLIRKNPFDFELSSVIVNDRVTREALTEEEKEAFLEFIREDSSFSKYYDGIFILFNTGLRISEFCGLTRSDLDFKEMRINVDHQLHRRRDMSFEINKTKTEAGCRYIPMSPEVARAFKRILSNRKSPKIEPMVNGYVGFLFLDKNNKPMVALHWQRYFQRILDKYNKTHRTKLPKITPHVCRHTFCTKMAKSGMNPKTLQYIMGHANISITLNTYTHVKYEDAKEEFDRLLKAE